MIILRNKVFAVPQAGEMVDIVKNGKYTGPPQSPQAQPQQVPQEITSRDLQIEQMRLQRQQRLLQHQKAKLQVQEGLARTRAITQRQKIEDEKREHDLKNIMEIHKRIYDDNEVHNPTLYKSKSTITAPVAMPK
jgi:hypothetical protein